MGSVQSSREHPRLEVRNVGGISETAVELSPGVNALEGSNATNRTSFLQAIMAALGSERVSLKGDADEGFVELTLGDETYTRTLKRRGNQVAFSGTPYLDDPQLADLFAFLLESNEARRAVARSNDLRELIMRPVDTEAIQEDVARLENEKRRIDTRLDDMSTLADNLVEFEKARTSLQADLEDARDRLATTESEIEAASADLDESREQQTALEDTLASLRSTRAELADVRFDLAAERASLDALASERADLIADREQLSDEPDGDLKAIDERMATLRERRRTLESDVSELQHLIEFNEELLNQEDSPLSNAIESGEVAEVDTEPVTNQLVDNSSSVVCWTCGSTVEDSRIKATVDRLHELRSVRLDERSQLGDELDRLADQRATVLAEQSRREDVESRLANVESEIEHRESNVERLEAREADLDAEIDALEAEAESQETREHEEILALHRTANEYEREIGSLENELANVEQAITETEAQLAERDRLVDRRESVGDELAELRTRVETIELAAIEAFNEHMATILDVLGYGNVDRIWIERTERQIKEGRRLVDRSAFDLHVVRTTGSGATYEDTIDHLSESEREVTGLVFALAGYLVHEVYETVPFMLLDSLEAIDSARIAALVDYLSEYADCLVVALLPEDAAELDERHHRVTDI